MRFSKKTAHRIIISLAMVFPIAYMLGTQIATLAGAHGEELLADSSDVIIGYQEKKFAQWFTAKSVELGSFAQLYQNINLPAGVYLLEYNQTYNLESANRNAWTYIVAGTSTGRVYESTSVDRHLSAGVYTWRFTINSSANYHLGYWLNGYSPADTYYMENAMLFPLTWMYGAGNEPTTEDFLSEYPSVWYDYDVGSTTTLPIYGQGTYGQELTETLFPRHNFIEQVGRNSVSESPKGFAPFASMLRYLDVNMLHAGDTQIGLMFYGMIYWMLHVILADLVYHTLVFIPNLIMRVSQWLGHGLDDDKEE